MSKRRRVAVYGAGHLGRQVYHHVAAHHADHVQVLGFIDDLRPAGEPVIDGRATLGSLVETASSSELGPQSIALVFAIGYANMALRRAALERVRAAGYRLHSVIHPRAVIEPGAELGEGCVVLANAVIDQQVTVGAACFIDIGVRLTAGTRVGSNNYFSSGTSTGSRVVIGDDCFFGMDCTVTTEVRMGSRLFVNAKTLVPRNVGDDVKLVELHKSRELPLRGG
jgi:acetyltransferase-like isoleucine patch superfamily enzyme